MIKTASTSHVVSERIFISPRVIWRISSSTRVRAHFQRPNLSGRTANQIFPFRCVRGPDYESLKNALHMNTSCDISRGLMSGPTRPAHLTRFQETCQEKFYSHVGRNFAAVAKF